jgi:hypothetical protein
MGERQQNPIRKEALMPERDGERPPRDAAAWARDIAVLRVTHMPEGVTSLNVEGRRVVGPVQGFGQLWQKTYRVRLSGAGVTPAEVIQIWKAKFNDFWPESNTFYAPLAGISPGAVALIRGALPGGAQLSTGVMVLYADDESFTLMTPEGHPFAGWVTFSAFERAGATFAQVQVLIRANDPLYELGLRLGGHRRENDLWKATLANLAAYFGVREGVDMAAVCLDPKVQWREIWNIWHNAGVRSLVYTLATPARWLRQQARRIVRP